MPFFNFGWLAGYRRGGRTPQMFPMTLGYPQVSQGGKVYYGFLTTRVGASTTTVRTMVSGGKPQYGIIKFVPSEGADGSWPSEGASLYVMGEEGRWKELPDLLYISGATSWRDSIVL